MVSCDSAKLPFRPSRAGLLRAISTISDTVPNVVASPSIPSSRLADYLHPTMETSAGENMRTGEGAFSSYEHRTTIADYIHALQNRGRKSGL